MAIIRATNLQNPMPIRMRKEAFEKMAMHEPWNGKEASKTAVVPHSLTQSVG